MFNDTNFFKALVNLNLLVRSSTDPDPLLICTGFLKYPFGHLFQTEIKIDFKIN